MSDKKEKERLQKIISLTFDENPAVRKQAAQQLAESDEPAAIFALLELSYDKDESVRALAREILSKKQPKDNDAISFAEIFAQPQELESHVVSTPEEDLKKKKLLSPIEQIFEKKLGKERAALVKKRMMPAIERIYFKAVGSKPEDAEKREKSVQKLLTSYADVLSGLDNLIVDNQREDEASAAVQTVDTTAAITKESEAQDSTSLEEVGTPIDVSKISQDLAAIEDMEDEELETVLLAPKEKDNEIRGDRTIFRKAYDLMMASNGDEKIMFEQSQKLIKQLVEEVKLAFKLAKRRFKAENITHLTELKNGMRNVNTDILIVKSVVVHEYPKSKTKKDMFTRVVVNDADGSEGVIYLFGGRGKEIQTGMKVKVVKGIVKTFSFSGETALTVTQKGNIYIVV